MTTDEMIAVLQAAKERKRIECRAINSNQEWSYCTPKWDFLRNEYRVAPEKRSLIIYGTFKPLHEFNYVTLSSGFYVRTVFFYADKETALDNAKPLEGEIVLNTVDIP